MKIRRRDYSDCHAIGGFECVGESMTKQAPAHETDVNLIVARYLKSGDATLLGAREGRFADVSDVGDYLSALEKVRQADAAFAELSAAVRDHFGNDPAALLEALYDPARRSELEELGIVEKKAGKPDEVKPVEKKGPEPEPVAVEAVEAKAS